MVPPGGEVSAFFTGRRFFSESISEMVVRDCTVNIGIVRGGAPARQLINDACAASAARGRRGAAHPSGRTEATVTFGAAGGVTDLNGGPGGAVRMIYTAAERDVLPD